MSSRSFDAFVLGHSRALLRTAVLLTGSRSDAEDVLQTVLVRMYASWSRIEDPLPYARTALVHATRTTWRWRSRHREVPLAGHDTGVPDRTQAADERDVVLRALARLASRWTTRRAPTQQEAPVPGEAELSTVLTDAVEDVEVPASLLTDVRARGRRRVLRRRSGALALTALATTGAVAVWTSTTLDETLRPAPPSDATMSPSGTGVRLPDLVGITNVEVEEVLSDVRSRRGSVLEFTVMRYVTSDDAPVATLLAQDPPANASTDDERSRITLTFSSGGTAVPLEEVPAPAAVRLQQPGLLPGEQVLLVETTAGRAYKTDAMLTGPCAAVRLAYRTFPDPQYDDSCY